MLADSTSHPGTRAPRLRVSTAAAPPILFEVDDSASAIAAQLAGGPMGDARGIQVAVLGRRPSRVEQ